MNTLNFICEEYYSFNTTDVNVFYCFFLYKNNYEIWLLFYSTKIGMPPRAKLQQKYYKGKEQNSSSNTTLITTKTTATYNCKEMRQRQPPTKIATSLTKIITTCTTQIGLASLNSSVAPSTNCHLAARTQQRMRCILLCWDEDSHCTLPATIIASFVQLPISLRPHQMYLISALLLFSFTLLLLLLVCLLL